MLTTMCGKLNMSYKKLHIREVFTYFPNLRVKKEELLPEHLVSFRNSLTQFLWRESLKY